MLQLQALLEKYKDKEAVLYAKVCKAGISSGRMKGANYLQSILLSV